MSESVDRAECVRMAQVAEEAERYAGALLTAFSSFFDFFNVVYVSRVHDCVTDMAEFIRELVKANPELSLLERNLFATAFRQVVGAKRIPCSICGVWKRTGQASACQPTRSDRRNEEEGK